MNTKTIYSNYKKVFIVAIALSLVSISAIAQNDGRGDAAFNKGSSTLGFSLGAGVDYNYHRGYGYDSRYVPLPAFAVTFDHGIVENAGPGTVGVGGVIGFKSSYYNYYSASNKYRTTYTNFIIGVRGTYHLTLLKDKTTKFDPYAGVTIGLRIFDYKDNNPHYDDDLYTYNTVYPIAGAFIGAKYNFSKNFGVFGELGYDISFARIGLNINF